MSLLPRPLRLSPAWVRPKQSSLVFGLAAAILAPLFCVFWMAWEEHEIAEDLRILASGAVAESVQLSTHLVKPRRGPSYYRLNVSYFDSGKIPHSGSVNLKRQPSATPEVRYDPARPSRFAVSCAVEPHQLDQRRFDAKLIGIIVAVVGFFVGFGLAYPAGRDLRLAWACVRDGEDVLLDVLRREPCSGKNERHLLELTVHVPGVGGHPTETRTMKVDPRKVLAADPGADFLVAVVSPSLPGKPLVLEIDFAPFELTPQEQATARRRLAEELERRAP